MTDKEKNELKSQIENEVLDKVETKVKERFDSFREFVTSAYSFHTSALKNAAWIIGIAITIVSVVLTFFGIKTYNDIQTTIKSNIEKELSSDQVIRQYRDELTSLKSKLIINEIEQNIAVTNVYGTPSYRKILSDEYLQILSDAINRKDDNSIRCLKILNKYDDFVGGYNFAGGNDYVPPKLENDINKIENNKDLITSVFAISNDPKNPFLQREAYEFLISYGSEQQIENIVNQLKDYIIKLKTDYTSTFKDNAKDYLVRLIVKVKRNKKNTSIRRDIEKICKSSAKNDDIEIKFVGLLGLAELSNEKIENSILQIITRNKSQIDNLLSVTNSYSRYFYNNRYTFYREEEQQVYNYKFLSSIFEMWAADKKNKKNYIYYDWVPFSLQPSLYDSLFRNIIKSQKNADDKLWVIKVFVPSEIGLFTEKTFKELPTLKVKIKGKYVSAYYDRFEEKLVDENGEKILIDDITDFSILLKPNPNFDSDNSS